MIMKKTLLGKPLRILLLLLIAAWAPCSLGAAAGPPVFHVISMTGAITPPAAEYITQNISESVKEGAYGMVILLDTPGGLDLSMRDIAKAILNAPIPVFVYVYPSGARAASAGVIITVAAHVAAMAPGTNIGAAHPVGLGGGGDKTMMEKVANDAAAYVRSIAKIRGRNEEWVEKAVRISASITAEEALKNGVIDYVATDVQQLLKLADGKEVLVGDKKMILQTAGATMKERKMGLRHRILTTLSDPNIAYILFLVGLAGLYFEFSTPGVILPGVVGGISLILAFFAMQTLPVNYAAVLLILFGIVLFIAEIKVVSHGILTIGGIVSLAVGSLMLFDSPEPSLRVSLTVLIPTLTIISLFFIGVISLVIKAQMRKKHTGKEGMIGMIGKTVTKLHEEGTVMVKGEYWAAASDTPLAEGTRVRIIQLDNLKVKVEKEEHK
jgi:membrane-bound serine protease (ClpP class)